MTVKYNWSYSSISLFKQCPHKYYRLRVVKDVVDPPAEHLNYGLEVHKAAEDYIGKGVPIPEKYIFIKEHLDKINLIKGEKLCEYKMGLNSNLEPCGFFDKDVWVRGLADLLIIDHDENMAWVVDYKTGSDKYPDVKQLRLMALMTYAHFPEVDKIKAGLLTPLL